jgi:hypothetical protein
MEDAAAADSNVRRYTVRAKTGRHKACRVKWQPRRAGLKAPLPSTAFDNEEGDCEFPPVYYLHVLRGARKEQYTFDVARSKPREAALEFKSLQLELDEQGVAAIRFVIQPQVSSGGRGQRFLSSGLRESGTL